MKDPKKRCRHFNGLRNDNCEAGIKYNFSNFMRLTCWGEDEGSCEMYSPFSAEELAQQEVEFERHMDLLRQGLSGCCEAPIDTSQVIAAGRHKNHGPRFCSKCKKVMFIV